MVGVGPGSELVESEPALGREPGVASGDDGSSFAFGRPLVVAGGLVGSIDVQPYLLADR